MSSFIISYIPIIPVLIFIVSAIVSIIYKTYSIINKTLLSSTKGLIKVFYKMLILIFVYTIIFVCCSFYSLTQIIVVEVCVFLIFLTALTICAANNYFPKSNSLDLCIFLSFLSISGFILLLSKGMISMFFALELINSLIIYSFLASNNVFSQTQKTNSTVKIGLACIYQLVLNFFSSIILYGFILKFISYIGTDNFGLLKYSSNYILGSDVNSYIFIAFLIKLGVGPWIFYKVNIYANMNFFVVTAYSIIYGSLILILLFNLTVVYGMSLTLWYKNLTIFFISANALYFSTMAFQNQNIFIFLSFSTLLNFSTFIIQSLV